MQKIDIVIAWVDGGDANWIDRRSSFTQDAGDKSALASTRFASNDEIYFCIASILKYVPFCGTIFLVTDRQKPEFIDDFYEQGLCSKDKIKIVDHAEIFSGHEYAYPTFNSLTIETLIWRIKGISRYFIYLNDDFFFNAPAKIEDFLLADKIVVNGHWESSALVRWKLIFRKYLAALFRKSLKAKHTVSQMLGAHAFGFDKFFKVHHYPHIIDSEVFQRFFDESPELVKQQISHKFRSIDQFNPVSFAVHGKIKSAQAVTQSDISIAYLKNIKGIDEFIALLDDSTVKYGCIQSLDQIPLAERERIYLSMRKKFLGYLPNSVFRNNFENSNLPH